MNKLLQRFSRLLITVQKYFYTACIFQATAFFISIPFLVAHGLSFTKIALAGNILLNPFLLIFMFLSTLLFFAELCNLPSSWITHALEYFCRLWIQVLNTPSTQIFFLSIPYACIIFGVSACLFFVLKIINFPWDRRIFIIYIFTNLLCLDATRKLLQPLMNNQHPKLEKIFFEKGSIYIKNDNGKILIANDKNFKKLCRSKYFIEFELKPTLARKYGFCEYFLN